MFSAFECSPTLASQRAQVDIARQTLELAKAGLRPSISLTGEVGYQAETFGASGGATTSNSGIFIDSPGGGGFTASSGSTQLVLSQPVFSGGQIANQVAAAEATIRQATEALKLSEQNLAIQVVQSFADVIRDEGILAVRNLDVDILTHNLDETEAKFAIGRVTRTDVGQSEAQLASAKEQQSLARAAEISSKAEFVTYVCHVPGDLNHKLVMPDPPESLDDAIIQAEASNPLITQARLQVKISSARLGQAYTARNPSIALQASLGALGPFAPTIPPNYNRNINVSLIVSQPILTGGLLAANIRSAKAQLASDNGACLATKYQVRLAVVRAWSNLIAERESRVSAKGQTAAALLAAEGAAAEFSAGFRADLDVLLADQALRTAQVNELQIQHDLDIGLADVIAALGSFTDPRPPKGSDDSHNKNIIEVVDQQKVLSDVVLLALDRLAAGSEGYEDSTC